MPLVYVLVMLLICCHFLRWYLWEERNLVLTSSLCSGSSNCSCSLDLLELWRFFSPFCTLQLVTYSPASLPLYPQDGPFCRYVISTKAFLLFYFKVLLPAYHEQGARSEEQYQFIGREKRENFDRVKVAIIEIDIFHWL